MRKVSDSACPSHLEEVALCGQVRTIDPRVEAFDAIHEDLEHEGGRFLEQIALTTALLAAFR